MSIEKRIQRLEGAILTRGNSRIDPKDKVIVVSYPDGDETEFGRLKQERMTKLREKYGLGISEKDFLVIGIRKFARQ